MTKVKLQRTNVAEKFQEQLDNLNISYRINMRSIILTDVSNKIMLHVDTVRNYATIEFDAKNLDEQSGLQHACLTIPFTDFAPIEFVVLEHTVAIDFYGGNSLHITVPKNQ